MENSKKVFIIAEIGLNHDGSEGNARQLILAAKDCGVDAVKFQTHIAEAETLKNAPCPPYFKGENRFEFFQRTGFSLEQHIRLNNFSNELGLEFISSPFSLEAVDLLEKVPVKTYKIPSGEVTNIPLLIKVAQTGKKIIISSGMNTWSELDLAIEILHKNGARDISVLQCTSEYPCPPEKVGLNVMLEMRERYKLSVGLSDHSQGIAIPIAAVTIGASIIEKHFTLSKLMYGPDAKNSLEPMEFKNLVEGIRMVEISLHSIVNKNEEAKKLAHMKTTFEKSIVAAKKIPMGKILDLEDLAFKKPGDGIPARNYLNIIGKKLNKEVNYDHQFSEKDFS